MRNFIERMWSNTSDFILVVSGILLATAIGMFLGLKYGIAFAGVFFLIISFFA